MYKLLVNVDQLKSLLDDGNTVVFDVRHDLADHDAGRRAYEAGHIPGAFFLDHEEDLSAPKTGKNGRHPLPPLNAFAALMGSYGVRKDVQVVIYDGGNSMFAAHLWWMLRWMGHQPVSVLDGGWQAWLEQGGAVSTEVPKQPSGKTSEQMETISQPAMPTVSCDEVLLNIQAPRFTVLDARAENRFRGEVEPMDPVAGHIPGALNRPNTLNLDEKGRFRSPQALHESFIHVLGGTKPNEVVHQCGSGITACHNLLAMEIAGLEGSALYPGSWSEWCSDSTRPVATGN
ncbi:sulfurtransferase [Pusillimonas sp. DMV24BSW_D]|uniref:sulfurtransferase n=1 Tax=Neopusillimonas aestuarii TaxID=2716226 RepID=UPI00140ABE92|nr:sulfurtransferase [Pusillimonas sp. DMV24BSW_D]